MSRTIQRKIFAQKSYRVRLSKAAAKESAEKWPKMAVYAPRKRVELEIRKWKRWNELLLKKLQYKRFIKTTIDVLCREEGFCKSKIQSVAVEVLLWAAEAFISDLFRESVGEMSCAKRKTLNREYPHITMKMKDYKDDLLENWESIQSEK